MRATAELEQAELGWHYYMSTESVNVARRRARAAEKATKSALQKVRRTEKKMCELQRELQEREEGGSESASSAAAASESDGSGEDEAAAPPLPFDLLPRRNEETGRW